MDGPSGSVGPPVLRRDRAVRNSRYVGSCEGQPRVRRFRRRSPAPAGRVGGPVPDCYKQVWPNHPPFRPKNYTADLVDENVATGKAKSARDLPALAEAIGVPAETLEGEVQRYNTLAAHGEDTDFGKAGKFLLSLSTPPFYAVEVRPATVNVTSCGLRIDEKARVLRHDGAVIDGVFAAGECTGGILGETYMGSGNSLANACGFGRIAGEEAAHAARSVAAS